MVMIKVSVAGWDGQGERGGVRIFNHRDPAMKEIIDPPNSKNLTMKVT
jgi:hypothetical protein